MGRNKANNDGPRRMLWSNIIERKDIDRFSECHFGFKNSRFGYICFLESLHFCNNKKDKI